MLCQQSDFIFRLAHKPVPIHFQSRNTDDLELATIRVPRRSSPEPAPMPAEREPETSPTGVLAQVWEGTKDITKRAADATVDAGKLVVDKTVDGLQGRG